jgi:hypothetical protein
VLIFRKFRQRHNGPNIKQFILNDLDKLGILNKVVGITSDNENADKSATQNLNDSKIVRVSCQCHDINLAILNGLRIWDKFDTK